MKGSMQIERNKCNILELILLIEVIKHLIFSNRTPLTNKPESSLMLSVSDPQYIKYTQQGSCL